MKKILFLIVYMSSMYAYAANDSGWFQSTEGDNSNNFSNIKGNISINYNFNEKKSHTKNDAIKIIEQTTSETVDSISSLKWLDLDNNGKTDSLFVSYLFTSYEAGEDSPKAFSDLFVMEGSKSARVYHSPAYAREQLQNIAVGIYDGKKFFFIYSVEGSGNYLSGILYELDELNQLNKVYTLDSTEGISGSDIHTVNNKIVMNQLGKSYALAYKNNKFSFVKYNRNISYPDLGESTHIVRLINCKNSEFTFDNKLIDPSYLSTDPSEYVKEISVDEEIIVMMDEKIYRASSSSELEFIDGVQLNLKALKKGKGAIEFYCDISSMPKSFLVLIK